MYHPSYLSPAARQRTIDNTQSSGRPIPLRKLLENEKWVAERMICTGCDTPRARMMLAEAEEQLTLLDAIEYGFIRPILDEQPADLTPLFEELKTEVDYPAELLAARRAAFVGQIKDKAAHLPGHAARS